jgi:hypothetical protein
MNNENITYCVKDNDLDCYDDSELENSELAQLINEFEQMQSAATNNANLYNEDDIMSEMQNYELNFTIKQLLIICDYYGITKQAKNAEYYGSKARTMKKSDIISLIMMFERNIDNIEVVMKRKELWYYLDSLKADKIMKKFVLW